MSDQYYQVYYLLTDLIVNIAVLIAFTSILLGVGIRFLKKL